MIIESLQNARVKRLVALQQKRRERNKQQQFVVEGEREVERALACGYVLQELWVGQGQNLSFTVSDDKLIYCNQNVFSKISYRNQASKCVGVFAMKSIQLTELNLGKTPFVVCLENVEKPGNLGAVLRTANAFGADAILVCDSSVDIHNPNVIRNSLGGFFDLPVVVCSSEQAIDFLRAQHINIVTTHLEAAKNYLEVDYTEPVAVIMGTEATGLTDVWVEQTNANVIIEMKGIVDSLNISVAAGVVMAEVARQRAN